MLNALLMISSTTKLIPEGSNIDKTINFITSNADKIIPIAIVAVLFVLLFKVVNKVVRLISSIVFTVYLLVQLFGMDWLNNIINTL